MLISYLGDLILDSRTCSTLCNFHSTYNNLHKPIIDMTPHGHTIIGVKLIYIYINCFNLELTLNKLSPELN